MSCCIGGAPRASSSWPGRIASLSRWAIPVAALAFVPKCPVCLAGYVLLFTGIGLSLSAAGAVYWGVMAVSVGAICYLVLRAARNERRRRLQG